MNYRHELKFIINLQTYEILKRRLQLFMKKDVHGNEQNEYKIRSIYFDNFRDKALFEKINGINLRDKYRIRFYNMDTSLMLLEKKSKKNSLCSKISVPITIEECEKILHQDISCLKEKQHGLAYEMYAKMQYDVLRPKTIVDYTREAYTYPYGNVRITFDKKVRSGIFSTNVLEEVTVPTMASNEMILEVKYDEFIPSAILAMLQLDNIRAEACSKYALSRSME